MKVVFLSREYPPESAWGGIATMYYTLSHALADSGHEVHIVCQAVGGQRDFVDKGVFVHRVGRNPKRYSLLARVDYSIHAWLKLREIIKRYDIEIVETTYWGAEAFLYSLRKRTPLVVRLDVSASDILKTGTYSGIRELLSLKLLALLEDFTAKRADRVIAISSDLYDYATERLHIGSDRVDLIHHSIDTAKFRFIEAEIRGRLGIPTNAPLVLFVGRLEARKGVHILCQAFAEIVRNMPATRFVLVGRDTKTAPDSDSMKSYVCREAGSEGYRDNLLFIDYLSQDELIPLYSASDVFVLPSFREGFSMVVLEAMACGKPVVVTPTVAVPDLELDGKSGIMVSPGDASGLAKALMKLLSLTEEDRKQVARKNRALVESRFSIPAWVSRVVDVHQKALERWHGQKHE
jgi:glycosyltransferase involved in cell wall biosynthesis